MQSLRRKGVGPRGGAAAVGAALIAACGGLPGLDEPALIGYAVPEPNPASYRFVDTTLLTVDAPVGPMDLLSAQAGVAELEFRQDPAGLEVVLRLPEYSGMIENPGQGALHAGAHDIRGAYILRLDPRGRVEVLDAPTLARAAAAVVDHESLVRRFFIRFPETPVAAESLWVDTVTDTHASAGTRTTRRRIITSSVAGDTTIDGRRLLLIRTEASEESELEGVAGGVAVRRRLAGQTRGRVLWDPARRLLVHRIEEGELSGTLAMPDVGVEGLPVRARVRRTVSLRASPRP